MIDSDIILPVALSARLYHVNFLITLGREGGRGKIRADVSIARLDIVDQDARPPVVHSRWSGIDAKLHVSRDEGRIRDVHRVAGIGARCVVNELARHLHARKHLAIARWNSHQSRSKLCEWPREALYRFYFLKYRPCWRWPVHAPAWGSFCVAASIAARCIFRDTGRSGSDFK